MIYLKLTVCALVSGKMRLPSIVTQILTHCVDHQSCRLTSLELAGLVNLRTKFRVISFCTSIYNSELDKVTYSLLIGH